MIIIECEQNTPEWFQARLGRPTASCFNQIITPKTMKPSTQAEKYLYTLAGERIAGAKAESFQSSWMERGLEVEQEARNFFEMIMDVEVKQVGLVYPDENKLYSCSPDGILDSEGLEIKCPAMHTHVGYLLAGTIPSEYIPQVQGSMLITGFMSWNFVSYYPGLPPLILKAERDDSFCAKLKVELEAFCGRLDDVEAKLRRLIE